MARIEFFELAAQGIPVLALALVVEARFAPRQRENFPDEDVVLPLISSATFFVMLIGEAAALAAVARGRSTFLERTIVTSSIVWALTTLVLAPILFWAYGLPVGEKRRDRAFHLCLITGSVLLLICVVLISP